MTGEPTAGTAAVAMIGGGRMAQALAAGFCRAGLVAPADVVVYDPQASACEQMAARVPGVRLVASGAAAARAADLVFLAVKPQQALAAGREVAGTLGPQAVLVSIVAGLPLAALAALAGSPRVVRVMPNTPCLVGQGVSVLCHAPDVPAAARRRVTDLLAAVGAVHEVDEPLLDAVTGLSGSGPGFVAYLLEALAEGGERAGLPAALALDLAVRTLAGTAALVERTGDHPAVVRERVCSPGGTTLAGLAVLDARGTREAVAAAVVAAAERSRELGRGAG